MSTSPFRIGTRGSQLALWQAHYVADLLRGNGHEVEIEVIRTTGDRMQDPQFTPPASFDGASLDSKGIFIKEIEDALAAGRIDLAVHSLKDLPTTLDPRFTLAAVPPRADARDAFVCEEFWGFHMLPAGARIGTTSPRRQAMLLALRPDVQFVATRGNIDTRLRKWREGQADALVLAAAGLDRLGQTAHVHQRFAVDEVCPAPGQGALGIETRSPHHPATHPDHNGNPAHDQLVRDGLGVLNHSAAHFATSAERAVLASLGGGCNLPLGAYCYCVERGWRLHAMVAAPDGEAVVHVVETTPTGISASELGALVADTLRRRGAQELLSGELVVDEVLTTGQQTMS